MNNYVVAIMLGNKVVKEFHNVSAANKQNAIDDAWKHNDAQQYADGKHKAVAYK